MINSKFKEATKLRQTLLEEKNIDLKNVRKILGDSFFSWFWKNPNPGWIKGVRVDEDGQRSYAMLLVNRAYSQVFHIPLIDYIGNPDRAVWKDASNYEALDNRAYDAGEPVQSYEHNVTPDGRHLGGWVQKWPLFDPDGNIEAIAGLALGWKGHGFTHEVLTRSWLTLYAPAPPKFAIDQTIAA